VFDQFTQLVSDASSWAYAVIFLVALLDVIVPIVPSETVVITAGVVASTGDLSLGLVILAAALGAFGGDNSGYWLARRYGERIVDRFFKSEASQKRIDWAQRQLTERGGELIGVGRFIPGGRTAVVASAGMLAFPWRRFIVFDAAAAIGWALYASLLGYFGGKSFEDAPWKGLLVAMGIALAVACTIEVVRFLLRRRAAGRSFTSR
jgi:membrane protein DedA with SNARE-associated domain